MLVVRDCTGRLVNRVGIAALVVLSERFGWTESVNGVPVVLVWLILQDVAVCVSSKGGTAGDQYA